MGERTIAKIELLKATITHPMNKSKYHLANNNCQKWVRHYLARIDRKLNEKKLPKEFQKVGSTAPKYVGAASPKMAIAPKWNH